MGAKRRKLNVLLSAAAVASLDEIWDWNAGRYGAEHADNYIQFLRDETEKLVVNYVAGRPVPSRPQMQYIIIQWSRRGHGHVAVYELIDDAVRVLDFFHTAQDWQNILP
jgi:plasmid stabilization system protein ParE